MLICLTELREERRVENCLSLKCQALVPDLGVPWPPCYVVVLSPPAQATCGKTGFLVFLSHRSLGAARKLEWVFSHETRLIPPQTPKPGIEYNTLNTCGGFYTHMILLC